MVLVPTVPQSSTLCQPVPSWTPELCVVAPKSERSCRVPAAVMATLMIAPFAAVRRRNRSSPLPAETFTFTLAQAVIVVVPRSW